MADSNINSKTIEGLLAFCDYLIEKGYAGDTSITPWKIAVRKVIDTVDAEAGHSWDVTALDVDDLIQRFEVKARGMYKDTSVNAYARRVRKAIEAYSFFLENNRPPTFSKRTVRRNSEAPANTPSDQPPADVTNLPPRASSHSGANSGTMIDFPFPLRSGQIAHLQLPPRLGKEDADRLSAFLRTLQFEEQPQLVRGHEDEAQAA